MTEVWDKYATKLAGGWKLVSYEMFDGDGPNKKLVAKHDQTLGRAIITRHGWLAAHIARLDRMGPLKSGKPWQQGEDAEVAHVARGMSMYCGYLKLFEDEKGLYWQTKVEICSDPSRFQGIQERRLTILEEGGKEYMQLEPKQDMFTDDGTPTRAVLRWEKFEEY